MVVCPMLATEFADISNTFRRGVAVSEALNGGAGSEGAKWRVVPIGAAEGTALELPLLVATAHAVSLLERAATPPIRLREVEAAVRFRSEAYWAATKAQHEAAQNLVQAHLRSNAQLVDFEQAVGDDTKCSTLDDVPHDQRRRAVAQDAQRWASEKIFAAGTSAGYGTLPPPAPQQPPPPGFEPKSLADLLSAEAHRKLSRFLIANRLDMEDVRANGANASRKFKPEPLVLAQSDMVAEARNVIWDLRRAKEGIVEPVDFTAPVVSDLNLDFLTTLLRDTPDKELLGHLRLGAHFKADLAQHTVLQPHMDSLKGNYDLVTNELERLKGKGWHSVYSDIPFFPLRLMPNGTVARKLEAARPRRTTNASARRTARCSTKMACRCSRSTKP